MCVAERLNLQIQIGAGGPPSIQPSLDNPAGVVALLCASTISSCRVVRGYLSRHQRRGDLFFFGVICEESCASRPFLPMSLECIQRTYTHIVLCACCSCPLTGIGSEHLPLRRPTRICVHVCTRVAFCLMFNKALRFYDWLI